MAWRGLVSLVAALLVAACGDDASEPESGGEAGAAGAGGSTMGVRPEQGPPPNAAEAFSVQLPEFTLGPGQEIEPCWIAPLDITESVFVAAASLTTTPGMHHGNVTSRPKTGEGLRECGPEDNAGVLGSEAGDIIKGGAVLFASSTQVEGTEWHRFPDGMAYRVRAGYEIVLRMHYLNSGTEPITVAPLYRWYSIPPADLVQELGPYYWSIRQFEIPPRTTHTVSSECFFYQDMHIVDALPHMHALGQRFTAGYAGGPRAGELWLDSKGFDPEAGVIHQYDPAVDLSQGDGATFSCTWNNTFDKVIGEGIGDNEMCILVGYAYPPENAFSALTSDGGSCLAVRPPDPDEL